MTRNHRTARRYAAGVGMAAGAVAAATMLGAPAARADDSGTSDLDLLSQAAADLTQAQANVSALPLATALQIVDKSEAAQAPLLSQDDPFSGFANQVFAFPDQQLAHAGDALSSAEQALFADPSSTADHVNQTSALFQFDAASFVSIPYDDIARLLDPLFGGAGGSDIGTISAASASAAATDAVTQAASAATATTPADPTETGPDVLGQAAADLTQVYTVLGSAGADDMTGIQGAEHALAHVEAVQAGLPAADQTSSFLVDPDQDLLNASEQLLSASQTLAAAEQAGDFQLSDFAAIPDAFKLIGPAFDVAVTTDIASLLNDIGISL